MTNPAHLSGQSRFDNFIVTRDLSAIYRDCAKTNPTLTQTATNSTAEPLVANFLPPNLFNTYTIRIFVRTNKKEMDTKLTIKLDNDVISRAKRYAQHRKTSLSKMIESYLDTVTKPDSDDIEITPLVKSLSGVISLPEDSDYKKDRTDYLIRKYS